MVGGGDTAVGEALLGRVEPRELGAQRVDALLARGFGRRRAAGAHGVDERDRVLVEVAPDPGRDLLDERLLGGVVGDERAEPLGLAGQRVPRGTPRREELPAVGERVAAGAGLEIQELLLGKVRGGDDLRRVARHPRGLAHVADRHQQRADRQPDHERQHPGDEHHPRRQAGADVHKSASGPSTSRTFSRSWMGEKGFVM